MPLVSSTFTARGLMKNPHFSTIYSAKVRRVRGVVQERERFELPDGDFIDVDWSFPLSRKQTKKVALLFHGLEGNAQRTYMLGMAKLLNQNGYDVASVNFRGCSGIQNRRYRSYHSGETEDIRHLAKTIAERDEYQTMTLYGVSLGGNAVLKYLGEKRGIPTILKAVATVGVPTDLKASLIQLNKKENIVYRTSFLVDLRGKYKKKMKLFPDKMSWEEYKKIKSLQAFDNVYTAPAHGFEDALDYYAKSSSFNYLPEVEIPTLVLNARNDSFLHGDCFPYATAKASKNLHLETPEYGGHVGFYQTGDFYYSELRSLEFFQENMK
ncbi:alpha/beta fold hydrolase [Dokdonia sinensis]|uniref:Alpha/beta fold hydrolase n=1 Tax=Dokdonia sinensis TaxID=2479847 RepID=A0A3M0H147_9FLAO|nr:alpha/beta fold hydrolase [Dokdonia sinensis]RMB63316.1 alpha/beta fold hydrolase [Dokdonia sinensis]